MCRAGSSGRWYSCAVDIIYFCPKNGLACITLVFYWAAGHSSAECAHRLLDRDIQLFPAALATRSCATTESIIQPAFATRILRQGIPIKGDAKAGRIRDRQHTIGVKLPAVRDNFINVGRAGEILDQIGISKG